MSQSRIHPDLTAPTIADMPADANAGQNPDLDVTNGGNATIVDIPDNAGTAVGAMTATTTATTTNNNPLSVVGEDNGLDTKESDQQPTLAELQNKALGMARALEFENRRVTGVRSTGIVSKGGGGGNADKKKSVVVHDAYQKQIENYDFMRRNSVRQTMARRGSILKPREHYRRGTVVLSQIEKQIAKGRPTTQQLILYNQLKGIKNKNLVHKRSMVGISVFASGGENVYDPFCVSKMPLDLQIGFRRKIFGILTFQTLIVNILVAMFTLESFGYHQYFDDYYCPAGADMFYNNTNMTQEEKLFWANTTSLEEMDSEGGDSNSTSTMTPFISFHFCDGVFLPALSTFGLLIAGLFMLYVTKYLFPVNYLMLVVFTLVQSVTFVGFKTVFNTNAAVFICGSTFLQVATMFFLSSQTTMGEDENDMSEELNIIKKPVSFYSSAGWAALLNFVVVTILSIAQVLDVSFLEYLFAASFATCIIFWFSYDATCMTHKMSPDEYMQAVVFFYTDVILFIVFLFVVCACMMVGDGGGAEGCTCCENLEMGAGGGFAAEGMGGGGDWGAGAGGGGFVAGGEGAGAGVGLAQVETGAMGGFGPIQGGDGHGISSDRRNNQQVF